jgi:tRNA pseudouridine38-40 synthase
VRVGSGKMRVEEFDEIIRARDRGRAGMTAPPQGLYLVEVLYP